LFKFKYIYYNRLGYALFSEASIPFTMRRAKPTDKRICSVCRYAHD